MGNDIVDLCEAECAVKSKDARFVSRVFNELEQNTISKSANRDFTLWMLWAAKETAYKIVSKLTSPPVFAHKLFRATLQKMSTLEGDSIRAVIPIDYNHKFVEVGITGDTEHIHAVGSYITSGKASDYLLFSKTKMLDPLEFNQFQQDAYLRKCFTDEERASIRDTEAALVRYYSKQDIAARLNINPAQLQIIRPKAQNKMQPPYLLIDNKQINVDISLSHHGKWVAWVYSMSKATSTRPQFSF